MSKLLQRISCLVIVCLFAITAIVGCGAGNVEEKTTASTAAKAESTAAQQTKAKEPVTLKLVHQIPPEINLQDNPILKKAEELTGIKLDIEAPPMNNYSDRLNIIMASGDLPDFFIGGTDRDFENWSKQGLLMELDGKITADKYPNLMKNINAERWGDTTSANTGKIQGVPKPNNVDMWGYLINNEWLKNVNMQPPTTIDEFLKVSAAFSRNDPDKNGKDDTYGYTCRDDIWHLDTEFIKTAWNLSIHHGLADADGSYRARHNQPGTMEYLSLLKKMFDEKIIDPEFFTNKDTIFQEKFLQGKAGIIGASHKESIKFIVEKGAPIDKYSFYGPLASQPGAKGKYIVPPSNWMAFLIPSSTKKLDDVLRFLDFANSEEGFKLFLIGIKGVHYNSYDIEKRVIDRTPEQVALLKKHTSANMAFANGYLDRPVIEGGDTPELRTKFQTEWANAQVDKEKIQVPFVKMYDAFFATLPDLTEKVKEMDIKYITGNITKEQYVDFLNNEYKSKTGDFDKEYDAYMKSLKK